MAPEVDKQPKPARFKRLALIGVGLIGSSIARATKRADLADNIVGCARTPKTRDKALELGIVDAMYEDPAEAVAGADLVIICSHLGSYVSVGKAIAASLAPGAIVTDVGSVKGCVARDLGPHIPDGVHLVPGHPVSGSEKSGPEAGFETLFDDRWWILTPDETADGAAVQRLAAYVQALGSRVEIMAAERHDLVLAITSHLPHLIAYNIVSTADDMETVTQGEVVKYSAGGFRDFTRIAASDPEFWRDVFLNNRDAVLETLGRFTEDLIALQRSIRWGEGDELLRVFSQSRDIRQRIIQAGQDTEAPNFGRQGEASTEAD
ncbi:MAG: prephenate/arogenate dehydrogenase family protein [Alphaproteobacteria bacterium]|jgi:cyclohexadieny/prephenate dehydrogenase|nr:cyclohexadienyl dehydrogenase [Rhodospirillaceae bacterium]MDP6022708.1 prephenate/arogenate dehydrogenase family protein [Alphaproteobacteria bacterium]MDP6254990.1 prephenate/arogenate dehydrogenase family protein [Alphaproteobacteria bacterium]MDP7054492.1 prephenate/arogenate dehydrogenase family protein [Alphaproteobacteria bacterium]MDP7231007.1 prephenate/arogenate dehydrogenase family protein [Alphaproteobacteria bacterium]|tara:strand:- start:2332 stop:3291 length:960 start_codon:yes stop_codon:yes gene_type:complete